MVACGEFAITVLYLCGHLEGILVNRRPQFVRKFGRINEFGGLSKSMYSLSSNSCTKLMSDKMVWWLKWRWIMDNSLCVPVLSL